MGRTSRARRAGRTEQAAASASAAGGAQSWYVAQANQGERSMLAGQMAEAAATFASILARLAPGQQYERAVILERLGRCLHALGRSEASAYIRQAMEIAEGLPSGNGARALRGVLRTDLGDMLCAAGRYEEAREAYGAALGIARESGDTRAQGVDLGQMGALALLQGDAEEALTHYGAALEMFRRAREPDMEAIVLHQLGRILHGLQRWDEASRQLLKAVHIREARGQAGAAAQSWNQLAGVEADAGRLEAAEAAYRKALAHVRHIGDPAVLGRELHAFAGFLLRHTDRLLEARQLAEEALLALQSTDPVGAQVWQTYGLLADILQRKSERAAGFESREGLAAWAEECRRLQRKAPSILAALGRLGSLGEEAGYERAMLIGRLARCLHLGRRPDLALGYVRQATDIAERLPPDPDLRALLGSLHADRAQLLCALGQDEAAREAYAVALVHSGNDAGQDALVAEDATQTEAATGEPFAVTIHETLDTDCVFEPDLMLDGRHEERSRRWAAEARDALPGDASPVLAPWTRTVADGQDGVRFLLHPGEPVIQRRSYCTLMRRTRREVAVSGRADLLWQLVRAVDGARPVEAILSPVAEGERDLAQRILAALAATGVLDMTGRPVGRLVHSMTKKGVLPGGGLAGEEVLRLATDGDYRCYPDAPRTPVSRETPEGLQAFHDLTRRRRSRRDYGGQPISRADLDALLHTACGVTGTLSWMGQETKLRAYPASGALYAVEIYPAVLRVEGLPPAIYHYRAGESELERVRPDFEPADLVAAALPVEREMVAGAAAMICLCGFFPRHERKYGEGGYRMMVAEAGHISQNLILAATAMGLAARPFGGVFDALLNRELGLDGEDEQFLLAVLVGRAGGKAPGG